MDMNASAIETGGAVAGTATVAPEAKKNRFAKLTKRFDQKRYQQLNESMSFDEYVERVYKDPRIVRNAFQRIYDMIMSFGADEFTRYRKNYLHYKFFDAEWHPNAFPIYGLDVPLNELVSFFRSAAGHHGTHKRVLLLRGPVGSSKSTICDTLKKGLEVYSQTDDGAWYTFKWINLPIEGADAIYTHAEVDDPMNEDPIRLLPVELRQEVFAELTSILKEQTPEEDRSSQYALVSEGDVNPFSRKIMDMLLRKYKGDREKVLRDHVRVIRKCYSEADRIGIGTFQPKDEKNQDSTELTGDIDFSRIATFGKDSDARAFSFDGEFCVANRGICEFIEMLKLANEFLYDLLGATQEHHIKPKKFPQVYIDEVLIAHTNTPEYDKLTANDKMEALRDRTFKIDIPYLLRLSEELKIYEKCYSKDRVGQHIAPHTLEIAAFFAILTRLFDDPNGEVSNLRDKVKLYDDQNLPNWNEDKVKELMDKSQRAGEGMQFGVSARYIQDKISLSLSESDKDYINFFMVLNKIKDGLSKSTLITNPEMRAKYSACVDLAIKELDNILKTEVQRALVADENALVRLCDQYIDNVMAYIDKVKIENPLTGKDEEPNERLMREIETKIDVPEQQSDDFRLSIQGFIGKLSRKSQKFSWHSNAELKRALEKKVFEDTKDTIKLSALSSATGVVDDADQQKIDAIKTRLIRNHGYNEASATDVLKYVSSIFARGEVEEN